tara:strand:- start:34 stop:1470 length:1437 start_codon:yes stop_codon:yes gene_type:complete
MANYNVTLSVAGGKGAFATFSATNGDGLAYNDPLDVNIGDTVTFIRGSGSGGTAKFRDLTIFTSNADIDIAYTDSSVVRTVASGSALLDSITGYNGGETQSDTFFFERQAATVDSTPNSFDFTNQTGVTRSSTRTSANTVTIAGMDSGASATVTVSGGTYSKNGGSYSSSSTTASNGTTFTLRHTSSSSYSTSVTTTLTVGGVSGSFVSTTEAAPTADTTPNAFNLQDIGPIAPGTVGTSVAQQITGMDANTACSVSGQGSPQLRVGGNSGTWTTSSTISPNFYINVRLTAPTAYSSSHTATLTIGTVTDTITVTSQAAPTGSGGTSTSIAATAMVNGTSYSILTVGTTNFTSFGAANNNVGTVFTMSNAPGTGTGTVAVNSVYGIKVFDTGGGSTTVISPNTRYMTRLTDPTSISLSSGSSTVISCNMTGLSSSNSDIIFEQFATSALVPVTRESNGFRITNNTGGNFTNIVYAVRF